jgi:phenylacetate-CoA ligase
MTATDRLHRHALVGAQARRLAALLRAIHGRSRFYTAKLSEACLDPVALQFPRDLARLPLTTKAELVDDQAAHPPWGTVVSEPLERYTRYSQTSSTTGRPLRWIDTPESWQWMVDCWKPVYRAARVEPGDRVVFAFSFGPFLGFWTGFEAGCQMGLQCIPTGGMATTLRLATIEATSATVVCCTPTYALHLAEVSAAERGPDALARGPVRVLIVAGEPGGSIPATRTAIETSWGARVIDHHGLTEAGPVSFECWDAPGFLHVNEHEYVCEVLDPETSAPVPDGQPGELVITNLGRSANPVIRYRTGDIVTWNGDPCPCGRTWARLVGGILGRADDMVSIRGVNVYPTAVEAIVRGIPEVVEFRSVVTSAGAMRTLRVEVELDPAVRPGSPEAAGAAARVAYGLREGLGLSVEVRTVEPGALPRFEMKASRFVVLS